MTAAERRVRRHCLVSQKDDSRAAVGPGKLLKFDKNSG